MPILAQLFDTAVRNNPLLPRLPWLRNSLRKPYHRLLHLMSSSLPMTVGSAFHIDVPPRYVTKEMADYEVPSCLAIKQWVDQHPGCYFVDIGCAFGFRP
jgi:hypothetical protein